MAEKLTRLTHKIAIQLHLMAESCNIYRCRSRLQVRKLLDTPSYVRPNSLELRPTYEVDTLLRSAKEFNSSYGNRMFITVFTRVRKCTLY
jgi:hypothetical protein